MSSRQKEAAANLGRQAESYFRQLLRREGFAILLQNYRCPRQGEIDIVAQRGKSLICIEVKARTVADLQYVSRTQDEALLTKAQSIRIRRCTEQLLVEYGLRNAYEANHYLASYYVNRAGDLLYTDFASMD